MAHSVTKAKHSQHVLTAHAIVDKCHFITMSSMFTYHVDDLGVSIEWPPRWVIAIPSYWVLSSPSSSGHHIVSSFSHHPHICPILPCPVITRFYLLVILWLEFTSRRLLFRSFTTSSIYPPPRLHVFLVLPSCCRPSSFSLSKE